MYTMNQKGDWQAGRQGEVRVPAGRRRKAGGSERRGQVGPTEPPALPPGTGAITVQGLSEPPGSAPGQLKGRAWGTRSSALLVLLLLAGHMVDLEGRRHVTHSDQLDVGRSTLSPLHRKH